MLTLSFFFLFFFPLLSLCLYLYLSLLNVLWEVQFMSLITQTASSDKVNTFGAEN
jgi:hypothetical protein